MYDITEFVFIEQPIFTRLLAELTADEPYRKFQIELADRVDKWPVVRGTGGLRKARMRLPGRGKSGSARVLYLWFPKHRTICLYLIFSKGDIENLPADQLKPIRNEVQRIKKTFGEED